MISLPLLLAALVCSIPDRVQHAPERASKGEDEQVFSRIVYINLDTSPDRAESLASQCEQFSVPCSRFPALGVDATRAALLELGWAPLRAADDAGARPFFLADAYRTAGCFLSHYLLLRQLRDEGSDEGVMVVEDDVMYSFFVELSP